MNGLPALDDTIFEVIFTLVLLAICTMLLTSARRQEREQPPGWRAIMAGFSLMLFGAALDITDNYPSLNALVVVGNTPVQTILEEGVGFLGGVSLLAWGLWRWLPFNAAARAKERELFLLKERYRAISAITSDLNYETTVEPDGSLRTEWIVGSLRSDSGYGQDDVLTPDQWRDMVLPEDLPRLEAHIAESLQGNRCDTELRVATRDGRILWLVLSTSPAHPEAAGGPKRLFTAVRDISMRKQAEEQTRRSLEENQLLLQELHHRVKNNLQIITGLIELAKNRVNDPELNAICQDLHSKIGCMALVHTQLYADQHMGRINFGAYARRLAAQTAAMYDRRDVEIDFALDDILLDIDTAVPCGLALNELLTNAFKHALHGGQGRITVTVRTPHDREMLVSVGDNGPGLPPGAGNGNGNGNGIGLMLLNNLVTLQLRGSIEFASGPGTLATMRLPLAGDAPAAPLHSKAD